MAKRSRAWQHKVSLMHHLQIWEDFISFITEELLVEAGRGKPTIINPKWFHYKLLKFLHRDLKKGFAVLSKVPPHFRSLTQQVKFIDDWEQDVIDNEYEKFKEQNIMELPETRAFNNEVNEFVEERWGKEWVLYLNGEINKYDLAKLYQLSLPKIRRFEKSLFRHLVNEFVDEEKRKEIYNSYGLDGETPLKQIITIPYVDAANQTFACQRRMEPAYWETLADKIEEEQTGLTREDKKKLDKIAALQKEMNEIEATIRGKMNERSKNETKEST